MTEQCGCNLNFSLGPDDIPYDLTLAYCPMHKAAPEMLAALTRIATAGTIGDNEMGEWMREQARKAIAQARGEEVEA